MSDSAFTFLLDLYNFIWNTGDFPPSWSVAVVIPIPKSGMDHLQTTNYCPISLASCLCKVLEKMVNARLMWFLESGNFLTPVQYGFRNSPSFFLRVAHSALRCLKPVVLPQPSDGAAMFLYWHLLRGSCWKPALIIGAPMEFALECRLIGQHVGGFKPLGNDWKFGSFDGTWTRNFRFSVPPRYPLSHGCPTLCVPLFLDHSFRFYSCFYGRI